jgi:hypothetical protein
MKTARFLLSCLLCVCLHTQAQVIADFENWHLHSAGLNTPNGWNGSDSLIKYYGTLLGGSGYAAQIEKSQPGNGSQTALKVSTVYQPAIGTFFPAGPFPGIATNGVLGVNIGTGEIEVSGGLNYTANPTQMSCWVKNYPVGGDTTEITVFAIDNSDGDNLLYAIADTLLTDSITNFTKITIPFKVTDTNMSTTLLRVLVSSSGGLSGTVGTSIIVDDIEVMSPNGIVSLSATSNIAKVFPTRVYSEINLAIENVQMLPLQWKLFDSQGACVQQETITQLSQTISCTNLASGNYFYHLISTGKKRQEGKLIKVD